VKKHQNKKSVIICEILWLELGLCYVDNNVIFIIIIVYMALPGNI